MDIILTTSLITAFEVFSQGCPVGLLRSNSSAPCKYPCYGKQCSYQCNCSEEYCNHVIGCVPQQDCPAGFHGVNCTKHCIYPNYGVLCQQFCNCSDGFICDHIEGCMKHQQGCPAGFYGRKCVAACRYPNYGERCQRKCNCPKTFCDHIEGCCPAGFSGSNCSTPCLYPYYGEQCKYHCNCTEELCDHITGCTGHQESFTVPGDLKENVNITKKTIMEKHQTEFVTGICISVVLVIICVSVIIKLRKTKKRKGDTPQTSSSYVECPAYNMRSSHSYVSLFVNRRNNPDAYENTRCNNFF